MKSKPEFENTKTDDDDADTDNNITIEKKNEFDGVIMLPVKHSQSKNSTDEGIELNTDKKNGKIIGRFWSFDSTNCEDEQIIKTNLWPGGSITTSKNKITRCSSSDSAVLSDDDPIKGWENLNVNERSECDDSTEERPRYWRTPSVVVSDYSDYSYLEEKYERNNDGSFDKYEAGVMSGSTSQASSCSCLDCDDIREFNDTTFPIRSRLLQVCGQRRHSDSCCACITATSSINKQDTGDNSSRRNSCLATPDQFTSKFKERTSEEMKCNGEFLGIPLARKISDCSTNSSLSGDEFEVTELQPLKKLPSSGWRKLRNIVQWTPFFQTYKKHRYPWVQLAGHQGNFRAGPTPGTILKKLCPQEEACFRLLMQDVLRPYVPEFKGVLDVREVEEEVGQQQQQQQQQQQLSNIPREPTDNLPSKGTIVASYLQLQDLLGDFDQPCVMDCKVGVRTYLESELAKAKERPKLRKDMYDKMIQVDPSAPNTEERRVQGVTKPRYMVWRETISSTATLGFRVEGIKLAHGGSSKDFKTTRSREQVTDAIKRFVANYPHVVAKYLQRLKAIRATLKASSFFATHEVVGSSLLFVHDDKNAGIWMIDFAKTLPLPGHLEKIEHDAEWQVGNHEDGYLIGVNNLIDIFEDIRNSQT